MVSLRKYRTCYIAPLATGIRRYTYFQYIPY